ncbi:hypothetical protein C8R46DRAFT_1205412 [Mycena filopes]|nr:hypothetical protein C8R46DRAFT_1205412 [Mycena filopes]
MPSLPNEHWPFRLHTHLETTSVVPTSLFFPLDGKVCVHIRGEGPNHVSLSLEGVGNTSGSPNLLEIPNVDTLLGAVDTTRSSWTWKPKLVQITIKLCFPTPELLDAFLFALSYVRLSDSIETRSPSTIPLTERRLTQQDAQRFREMRASIYSRQATIAVLPVELLSEVLLFLVHSGDETPTFGSTLLPLRVCSEWRSVAIGTASLWRSPPTFTISPSFFRRGGGTQAVLWLERAKGRNVALSIRVPSPPPSQVPDLFGTHLSTFTAVQSLYLVCPPSQLQHFLGPAGPPLSSLEALHLVLCSERSYGCLPLCRSAPLLREVSFETEWRTYPRHSFNLVTAFPWAQLARLCICIRVEIPVWLAVLAQCTSLETGKFVLFDDSASPYPPPGTVTLPQLVSLRLVFRHVCDTRFFDHLAFPALRQFHVGGNLGGHANVLFLANYPTLHDLFVDLDVPGNGLQDVIEGTRGPSGDVLDGVGLRRLRSLAVLTSTPTNVVGQISETYVRWITKTVLTGCNFDLHGPLVILRHAEAALEDGPALQVSVHRDVSMDPFDLWRHGIYLLRVRKLQTK